MLGPEKPNSGSNDENDISEGGGEAIRLSKHPLLLSSPLLSSHIGVGDANSSIHRFIIIMLDDGGAAVVLNNVIGHVGVGEGRVPQQLQQTNQASKQTKQVSK